MAGQLAAVRYAVKVTTDPGWTDVNVCGQLGGRGDVAFVPYDEPELCCDV